jgi:hypothetical protein
MRPILILLSILLLACNSNHPSNDIISIKDSSISKKDTLNLVSQNELKNQKDSNGWKQGVWGHKERGHITGYETYTNDTLNGKFRYWINYPDQIVEGQYDY